jgi:hypothetical protein
MHACSSFAGTQQLNGFALVDLEAGSSLRIRLNQTSSGIDYFFCITGSIGFRLRLHCKT